MRNPLSRLACRDHAKPSLRQRAAALRASAARVMQQPAPAAPLPAPGSEEAKGMFRAACEEHARLAYDDLQNVDPRLQRDGQQLWCTDTLSRALEDRDITPAEFAVLYPLAQTREHRIDAAALATNVHALHALAFATDLKVEPANDSQHAAKQPERTPDLSAVPLDSLFALADLYDSASRHFHVGAFWPKTGEHGLHSGKDIVIREGDRLSTVFDAIVEEIAKREPADECEADQQGEWLMRKAMAGGTWDEAAALAARTQANMERAYARREAKRAAKMRA